MTLLYTAVSIPSSLCTAVLTFTSSCTAVLHPTSRCTAVPTLVSLCTAVLSLAFHMHLSAYSCFIMHRSAYCLRAQSLRTQSLRTQSYYLSILQLSTTLLFLFYSFYSRCVIHSTASGISTRSALRTLRVTIDSASLLTPLCDSLLVTLSRLLLTSLIL